MSQPSSGAVLGSRKDLDALVALISSSVDSLANECAQNGLPLPSLDSTAPVTSQLDDIDAQLRLERTVKTIVAACTQLSATVMNPQRAVVNKIFGFEESAALHVVASANIAGILIGKPGGLHVDDLSTISGIDADHLGRVMLFLASGHIFREVKPNVFANNRLSAVLATEAGIDMCTTSLDTAKLATHLPDFLLNHGSKSTISSPFHLARGMPFMEFHNTPEGKATVPQFMKAVSAWTEMTGSMDSLRAFPWTKYFSTTEQITVCDVGAGDGHVMLMLARTHASYNFRVIVQDRPAFVDLSKQLWAEKYPEAVEGGKVEFAPIDFFLENPVKQCQIYYIRHCIHNWPDDKCIIILKNIASSMRTKQNSLLLVHEVVLRHATVHTEQSSGEALAKEYIAPAPLLSNFGAAALTKHIGDMNMMNLLDAKERTLDEFITLGSQADLTLEHVWDAGETSILQFKLSAE